MLGFIGKIPATIRWVVIGVVAAVLIFLGGRCSGGSTRTSTSTTTTASASTSTSSSNSASASTSTNSSSASSVQAAKEKTVYKNQATLRQDKDTDCTEDFDPNTGKLVRRHCVTKTRQDSSASSTGGSVSTSTGSAVSGSTSLNTSSSTGSSTSSNTSSSNTTTTTTTTETKGGGVGGFFNSKGLHLTLIGDLALLDAGKPVVQPGYGAQLSKDLIGPLSIGIAAYTSKSLVASLGLGLGKDWAVSGNVGVSWTDFTKPFYGASIDHRILGPIWLGVWGYTDRSGGISASITVP